MGKNLGDIRVNLCLDDRDERGRTPLMLAARSGDLAEVKRLIAEGADVNAANPRGTTPVMYAKTAALGSGDFAVLDALVAAGADVAAKDTAGLTARDYAEANAAKVISYLKGLGG